MSDGARGPKTWRQRLNSLLEDPDSSTTARIYSHFLWYAIVTSIAGFILETVPSMRGYWLWDVIEPVTTIIFTVEYVLRFLVSDAYGDITKCGFVRSPMNILDVLAILPFYLEVAAERIGAFSPLRVLRSVRLIRCFRIFKLSKYSMGMSLMVEALINSAPPLTILMFFLCIGVVLFSSLMYFAERLGCPDVRSMVAKGTFIAYQEDCESESALDTGRSRGGELCCNEYGSALAFDSIASTFWWSIVTMTTCGYGDRVPRTLAGRLVGGTAMLSGIVLISLPVAIVGSKFQMAYLVREEEAYQEALERECSAHEDEARIRPEIDAQVMPSIASVEKPLKDVPSNNTLSGESPKRGYSFKRSFSARSSAAGSVSTAAAGDLSLRWQQMSVEQAYSLQRLNMLRDKLKKLETSSELTEKGTDQIHLLLEMFDHIERVEKQLAKLRQRDETLDICIRRDLAALAASHDVQLDPANKET